MPDGSMQIPNKSIRWQAFVMGGVRATTYTNRLRVVANLAFTLVLLTAGGSIAKDSPSSLELKTTAFKAGGTIPTKYTCSGADISPALSWNQPPPRTQSFALIVDDPDAPAGTWVHWVVYNLPASARQLPEHAPLGETIVGGGKQGLNDFPQNAYGGPCPPPGKPHRYFFRLYALDTLLDLHAPVHRRDVDAAMQSHILARAELMGTFGRQRGGEVKSQNAKGKA
jgi:Raf kinase inhibitor-like YbhB/YbcL family protein